jgi:acyl CoA:acetate/3-ketoacid CoA transferase beta subunit
MMPPKTDNLSDEINAIAFRSEAIERVLISRLKPSPHNARTHDERQLTVLMASMRKFGFMNPVLANQADEIIAGHGRVAAAKRIGLSEVPVIRIEGLSEAQIRAYRIADNRIAELAGWDYEILAIELQHLDEIEVDFPIEITGFTSTEFDVVVDKAKAAGGEAKEDPADRVPPLEKQAVSRPGDLWLLGPKHRLLCGSALVPANYDRLIEGRAADLVGDGSAIQMGVGALPDAILRQLRDRRDLGVHSGMIGDGFVDLVEAGIITNARKEIDTGVSVAGALVGTSRLYRSANRNTTIRICPTNYTHGSAAIARLSRFVSINSALEVDLTGQVNAEAIGNAYSGATGGQLDFARAAANSRGGRSIIALSATAKGRSASRIVARLSGPVTAPHSDADVIVTEFGAAELKGCSLAERARRMVGIAHPDFRDELDRAAHAIARQGF